MIFNLNGGSTSVCQRHNLKNFANLTSSSMLQEQSWMCREVPSLLGLVILSFRSSQLSTKNSFVPRTRRYFIDFRFFLS